MGAGADQERNQHTPGKMYSVSVKHSASLYSNNR